MAVPSVSHASRVKTNRKKYRKAANEVIEESRLMATDLYKQAAITSFDNKFISLIPLKAQFFIR